jgi:putative transposase
MRSLFRTRRELALENLALRQQVAVLIRTCGDRRLRLGAWDRAFWTILSQRWARWREALAIAKYGVNAAFEKGKPLPKPK